MPRRNRRAPEGQAHVLAGCSLQVANNKRLLWLGLRGRAAATGANDGLAVPLCRCALSCERVVCLCAPTGVRVCELAGKHLGNLHNYS
mmetsp:Transcript_16576/g.54045  ORF Transcript_16576/g.54045 Transcript_16576/m.54045 type:complete len:88 (-) Transcript_16576:140-403(-)|eukprot:scaffold870_cov108-Isochrysis_galbana.AAC.2